jgi:hypothetical protein
VTVLRDPEPLSFPKSSSGLLVAEPLARRSVLAVFPRSGLVQRRAAGRPRAGRIRRKAQCSDPWSHQADLHADPRRTAPSVPASSGVTAGGLSCSAVGRLDQPALPSAVPHLTATPRSRRSSSASELANFTRQGSSDTGCSSHPKMQIGFLGGAAILVLPFAALGGIIVPDRAVRHQAWGNSYHDGSGED